MLKASNLLDHIRQFWWKGKSPVDAAQSQKGVSSGCETIREPLPDLLFDSLASLLEMPPEPSSLFPCLSLTCKGKYWMTEETINAANREDPGALHHVRSVAWLRTCLIASRFLNDDFFPPSSLQQEYCSANKLEIRFVPLKCTHVWHYRWTKRRETRLVNQCLIQGRQAILFYWAAVTYAGLNSRIAGRKVPFLPFILFLTSLVSHFISAGISIGIYCVLQYWAAKCGMKAHFSSAVKWLFAAEYI